VTLSNACHVNYVRGNAWEMNLGNKTEIFEQMQLTMINLENAGDASSCTDSIRPQVKTT